jgi:hypothetical protein
MERAICGRWGVSADGFCRGCDFGGWRHGARSASADVELDALGRERGCLELLVFEMFARAVVQKIIYGCTCPASS